MASSQGAREGSFWPGMEQPQAEPEPAGVGSNCSHFLHVAVSSSQITLSAASPMQSSTEPQVSRHAPLRHTNGAQSTFIPLGSFSIRSSKQTVGSVIQMPISSLHTAPSAQACMAEHSVRHAGTFAMVPHLYGAQLFVAPGAVQLPMPSHVVSTSTSLVHCVAQGVAVGYAQVCPLIPSQVPHLASVPEQAARGKTGVPTTGVQMPSVASPLHASHWPSHRALQQTPSTQNASAQSRSLEHSVPSGV